MTTHRNPITDGEPTAGCLPAWDVEDLPEPRPFSLRNTFKTIGPGAILLAASIGGGEWLVGPAIVVQYGPGILWICTTAILLQIIFNMEGVRYTLYTGEPILTGIMRLNPGAGFWGTFYILLGFAQLGLPALAKACASVLFAAVAGRMPGAADSQSLLYTTYGVIVLGILILLSGKTIERTLERVSWFMIVFIMVFLGLVNVLCVPASHWWRTLVGFTQFGSLPADIDLLLLATFAATAGSGGIGNLVISNWVRDKGMGMGGKVGAIGGAFASHAPELSHIGKVFPLNPPNRRRWTTWWRYASLDQVCLWGGGCFIGMFLNVNLASYLVPENTDLTGIGAGAFQASYLARQVWSGFWFLTLLNGFWILFSTHLGNTDTLVRTMTDILWVSSPRVRRWRGGRSSQLYYGLLAVLTVWGMFAVNWGTAMDLFKVLGALAGPVLAVAGIQILRVNTRLLPRELRPSRWRCAGLVLCVLFYGVLSLATLWDLGRTKLAPAEPPSRPKTQAAREEQPPPVPFTDITEAAGIDFVHENGAAGEKLLPETMGGGCALFDFDGDEDIDIFFVNSQRWPWDHAAGEPAATSRLYRNDGVGNFDDITPGSGLDVPLYGMGVAVADYDNNGNPDLYVTAVGKNRLFQNQGAGKFKDVTDAAGVGGEDGAWSTSCGWLDYDHDDDLDLFVCNYVEWSRELDRAQGFRLRNGLPAYGRPQAFPGTFPYLFRNDGGKFTEVAAAAGLHKPRTPDGRPLGKALGVTFADLDNDGWLDLIVANDTVPNFLFHNRGNGTFEEVGRTAGIAYGETGEVRGAMGIDAARFRNDQTWGIAIGNFSDEMTALYVSYQGQLAFEDEAEATGIGPHTRNELTFGVCYLDYDLDGRSDLFAANGHLEENIAQVHPHERYEQPLRLFWNRGAGAGPEFIPVDTSQSSADLARPMVGRGAGFADIDGDGDLDLLATAAGQAPRLLRNDQQLNHHWLRLRLLGKIGNLNSIGAEVEVQVEDRTLRAQVMPTRSYLTQVEPILTFGLGTADRVEEVRVRWPDGTRETIRDLAVDQQVTIGTFY